MKTVNTITAFIYIGIREHYTEIVHDFSVADNIIQNYVNEVGLCVTVTRTEYIYTDGKEPGIIVGLINYPRFPSDYDTIKNHAVSLGKLLKNALNQFRVSIVMNDKTYMLDDDD